MTNIFNHWNDYIDAFATIYIDNNLDNLYDLYPVYYDEIINKKSNIDYYIIKHFLSLNTNNLLYDLLIYNGTFPLYHYHQYNLIDANSYDNNHDFITYENLIHNNYDSYQKLVHNYYDSYQKIYYILHIEYSYYQNINILYNSIPYINNHNIFNDFNDDLFTEDINNCKIIGFYIDILSKHYTLDISIFKDIPSISYNNLNNRHLYINKSFSYVILSNIKFYSNYLQNIDLKTYIKTHNLGDLTSLNSFVGSSLIFNNWDEFFYMFNYNKNGCDLDYDIIKNTTSEFYLSFYHIIKYILHDKNINNNNNEFKSFVQEGFDKFIYNVSHYTNTMILHGDIINLDTDDLYINFNNIIELFKHYNYDIIPNLDPLFEKVYQNINDHSIITNYDTLIDDFYINENLTIYHQRAILLDCIINIYQKDIEKSKHLNKSNLLNIVSEPYEILDLNYIIEDYYIYNIFKDLLKYQNWVDIEAKENPNNINTTYKKLRYMRLKYYSNSLKQFYINPNDE